MNVEGNLRTFPLDEILRRVSQEESTGILTVQGDQDIIAVSFLRGQVVAADAMSDTMEDGLGQILADLGLVTREDFAEVVQEQQEVGGRLPDLLVQRGLLGREQILDSLRLQIHRRLMQLLKWKNGFFKLFVGSQVSYDEGIKPISVEEVLIRALGDLENTQAPIPDLDTIYERRTDPRTVKILGADGPRAIADPGTVWLTPAEKELLDRLDGMRSAADLVSEMRGDRYRILYGLHRLLEMKLVRRLRKAPDAATAPSSPASPARRQPRPRPEVAGQDLPGRDLPGRDLPGRDLPGRDLPGRDLAVPDLTGRGLPGRDLPGRDLPAPDLPIANMPGRDRPIEDLPHPDGPPDPREGPVPGGARANRVSPFAAPQSGTDPGTDTAEEKPRDGSLVLAFSRLVTSLLAIGLTSLLATIVLSSANRSSLLFLFPWQESQRQQFEKVQLDALYVKLERAVKTYYLLHGQLPETLNVLAESHLIAPGDLYDSQGRWLSYAPSDVTCTIRPIEEGEPVPEMQTTIEISDDFLLNPEFTELARQQGERPLVLLD